MNRHSDREFSSTATHSLTTAPHLGPDINSRTHLQIHRRNNVPLLSIRIMQVKQFVPDRLGSYSIAATFAGIPNLFPLEINHPDTDAYVRRLGDALKYDPHYYDPRYSSCPSITNAPATTS
jgi:hypothetical protein